MTLAEFLLARIAEDEMWAKADVGRHEQNKDDGGHEGEIYDYATHRLEECASTRTLVAEWETILSAFPTHECSCGASHEDDWQQGYRAAATSGLRCLAARYASHSDYQNEWRPR